MHLTFKNNFYHSIKKIIRRYHVLRRILFIYLFFVAGDFPYSEISNNFFFRETLFRTLTTKRN